MRTEDIKLKHPAWKQTILHPKSRNKWRQSFKDLFYFPASKAIPISVIS